MNMLRIHSEAGDSEGARYHEFLTEYSANAAMVYGFVEGVQDPCYYRGLIDHSLPSAWRVRLWPVGGKKIVYEVYRLFDWERFSKKRVCFFVDRDFLDLTAEEHPDDTNIYVTDDYSIENSLVDAQTCHRALVEVCGFVNCPQDELDAVLRQFEEQYELFLRAMIPVTAWLLTAKRLQQPVYANNVEMNRLFAVVDGQLESKPNPRDCVTVADYLQRRCGKLCDGDMATAETEREIEQEPLFRRFVRGKFVLWFLVEFCLSIQRSAARFFSACDHPPRMHVALGHANAMVLLGNRGRSPETLRVFLRITFGEYIKNEHGQKSTGSASKAGTAS